MLASERWSIPLARAHTGLWTATTCRPGTGWLPEGAPPLSLHQATCTSGYSTRSSLTAYPWRPSAAPSRLATLASSPVGTSMAEWSCCSTSRTGTLKKSPLTRSVGAHLPQPGPLSGSPSWLSRRQGLGEGRRPMPPGSFWGV